MKRKFKIPVTWIKFGLVEILAQTEAEAIKIVEQIDPTSLPDGDYVEDSIAVDVEGIPFYNS